MKKGILFYEKDKRSKKTLFEILFENNIYKIFNNLYFFYISDVINILILLIYD